MSKSKSKQDEALLNQIAEFARVQAHFLDVCARGTSTNMESQGLSRDEHARRLAADIAEAHAEGRVRIAKKVEAAK